MASETHLTSGEHFKYRSAILTYGKLPDERCVFAHDDEQVTEEAGRIIFAAQSGIRTMLIEFAAQG